MRREEGRDPVNGYCVQILMVNAKTRDEISHKSFFIENISKGGFCFVADIELEIEDRIKALLRFPDQHSQEVSGRICYCNDVEGGTGYVYGFSIMDGFYSLKSPHSNTK